MSLSFRLSEYFCVTLVMIEVASRNGVQMREVEFHRNRECGIWSQNPSKILLHYLLTI